MVLLPSDRMDSLFSPRSVWVNGPIIIGAGPSGLAVAASLREQGLPFLILERDDRITSLWQKRTYDRLKLHLPEHPRTPFSSRFPEHPTHQQLAEYLGIRTTNSELGGRNRARVSCEPRQPAPRGSASSCAGRRMLGGNGDRDPRQRAPARRSSSHPASKRVLC
ncbi:hypothetical protein ZWY2020_013000 [Hordeum vulgare]|nr:hypothetical protein ZWY2020_013000 [Hordeum vulgare]